MGSGNLVCKLKKSIYGLKQASRQWYLKFDEVITRNGYKENVVDMCIYMKLCGSSFIFLVLYVDDTLLATNDIDSLVETKQILCNHFDMKNLGEASFALGLKIIRDRTNHVLQLSQKAILIGSLRGLIYIIVHLEVYQSRRVKVFLRISILKMVKKGW